MSNELPPTQQALHLMMGFWASQIVATVAKLGVPDLLADGAKSSDSLADACGANRDAMARLLRAAVDLGVLTRPTPNELGLTPVGECLRSDAPGSIRDLLVAETEPGHWLPWGHLYDAVKTGRSAVQAALGMSMWAYYAKHGDESATFARGMSNLSAMAATAIVNASDFSRFPLLVDVGGSQGALLRALLETAPRSRGILFDLPEVIDAGKEAVAQHGLGDRLTTVRGDFFVEVPAGGDAYFLKHILHDWSDEKCVAILQTIHRAAKPGSKLFVVEMLLGGEGGPLVSLMDVNMLVMMGDGRERTAAELAALFEKTGWRAGTVTPTKGPYSLVEATRV